MENASKALIIAGTILIAIITISVFYYMFGQVSTLVGDTSTDTAAEELEAYNASFEAYNKKLMYGADVISVMNKAIDNNANYKVSYGEECYVDISFILKEELGTTVETYVYDADGYGNNYSKTSSKENTVFSTRSTGYSLSNSSDYKKINGLLLNVTSTYYDEESGNTYDNSSSSITKNTYDSSGRIIKYTITYYPAAEFKRRTFTCTGVEYSSSGRINKMTFTEHTN